MTDRPPESTRACARGVVVVERGPAGRSTPHGADAPVDPDPDRFRRVRDAVNDGSLSRARSPDGPGERAVAGRGPLAAHFEAERIVAAVDAEPPLEHADDDTTRDRTVTLDATEAGS
jgi:hypothetical protein